MSETVTVPMELVLDNALPARAVRLWAIIAAAGTDGFELRQKELVERIGVGPKRLRVLQAALVQAGWLHVQLRREHSMTTLLKALRVPSTAPMSAPASTSPPPTPASASGNESANPPTSSSSSAPKPEKPKPHGAGAPSSHYVHASGGRLVDVFREAMVAAGHAYAEKDEAKALSQASFIARDCGEHAEQVVRIGIRDWRAAREKWAPKWNMKAPTLGFLCKFRAEILEVVKTCDRITSPSFVAPAPPRSDLQERRRQAALVRQAKKEEEKKIA